MRVAGEALSSIYPNEDCDKRADLYQLWKGTSVELSDKGHFVPFLVRNEHMETDLVGECARCDGLVAIDVQYGRAYGSILRIACGEPYTPAERGGYDEDPEV